MSELEELKARVIRLEGARAWAESLLSQYSDLYDFFCVSYFTLDRDAIINDANQSAALLLATNLKTLKGRSLNDFISKESHVPFANYLAGLFGKTPGRVVEISFVNDHGDNHYVAIEGKLANNGVEYRLAVIDITEQKQSEENLRVFVEKNNLA